MATKLNKRAREAKEAKLAAKALRNGLLLRYFGCIQADSGIGRMVKKLVDNEGKPVKDSVLYKVGGGVTLPGRFHQIKRYGRRDGFYTFDRSKTVPHAHVMHVKNWKAYLEG